jgi:hypothetical protein
VRLDSPGCINSVDADRIARVYAVCRAARLISLKSYICEPLAAAIADVPKPRVRQQLWPFIRSRR